MKSSQAFAFVRTLLGGPRAFRPLGYRLAAGVFLLALLVAANDGNCNEGSVQPTTRTALSDLDGDPLNIPVELDEGHFGSQLEDLETRREITKLGVSKELLGSGPFSGFGRFLRLKNCHMCRLPKPDLPPFTEAVEERYELDRELLEQVFQHSFNLSRTRYPQGSDRSPNYWFAKITIKGQRSGDILYQMLTGNIPEMWARDSMWQIIPYILYAKEDPTSTDPCSANLDTPSLRCLARGTIRSLAFFFQHDPFQTVGREPGAYFEIFTATPTSWPRDVYQVIKDGGIMLYGTNNVNEDMGCRPVDKGAWVVQTDNGYSSALNVRGTLGFCGQDDTGLGNKISGINYVSDQRYEPDGMASWVWATLLYDQQYPEEKLLQHPWVTEAMQIFIRIVKTEVNHDNSPYLDYNFNNEGKGNPVQTFDFEKDDALLTWVGYRPSDSPSEQHYLIPNNLYIATAMDSLATVYRYLLRPRPQWVDDARLLARKIARGVKKYGTERVKLNGRTVTVYAYEVNGFPPGHPERKALLMDDANYPNLQTLPLMVNRKFYNERIYRNTVQYIKTPIQGGFPDYYYDSSLACSTPALTHFFGLGSTVSTPNFVWPMAQVMDSWMMALQGEAKSDPDAFWANIQQLNVFLATQMDVLSFPEAFYVCNPDDPMKPPRRNDDQFGWMAATYALFGRAWWEPTITPYPQGNP